MLGAGRGLVDRIKTIRMTSDFSRTLEAKFLNQNHFQLRTLWPAKVAVNCEKTRMTFQSQVSKNVTCHAAFRRLPEDELTNRRVSRGGGGPAQRRTRGLRSGRGLPQQEGSPAPRAGSMLRTPGAGTNGKSEEIKQVSTPEKARDWRGKSERFTAWLSYGASPVIKTQTVRTDPSKLKRNSMRRLCQCKGRTCVVRRGKKTGKFQASRAGSQN